MKYILHGNPIPLARARVAGRKVYDSQKERKIVEMVEIEHQHDDQPQLQGPLHLDITFYMRLPQKFSRTKTSYLIDTYHYRRPDISNLIKWVEDIATGIIYKDDAQISSISSRKIYNPKPCTVFTLTPLNRNEKYEKP